MALRSLPSLRRPRKRLGDATQSFSGLRNLVTAQRFSNDHVGEGTQKRKAAEASEVTTAQTVLITLAQPWLRLLGISKLYLEVKKLRNLTRLANAGQVLNCVLLCLSLLCVSLVGCKSGDLVVRQPVPASHVEHIAKAREVAKGNRDAVKRDWSESKNSIKRVGFAQDDDPKETERLISSSVDEPSENLETKTPEPTVDSIRPESSLLPFENDQMISATMNSDYSVDTGISLEQVLESVKNCYPEIEIAIGEIETANGKILSSWGEFDRVVSGHSISQPLGFYQTFRNGVGVNRPLYSGGEVFGTYRIGDGNFEPWYGERETNEGGELKAGFSLPLLKDRSIDERRAKLLEAGAQRDQVTSNVKARLLQFQRFATQAYWDWVASGQAALIQQRLLRLAEERVSAIKIRVDKGDLAEIARIDNDRLIAKRKNDLIKARRSLDKAAIKLSLFWRDADCSPIVVSEQRLPEFFPASNQIAEEQLALDIENAFLVRPELIQLKALRREICIDRQYGENLMLPKLDVKGFAGQDLGGAASSKGDKTPFELQLGVFYEVPIERRKGRGKIQSANGKLTQVDAKIRLTSDKIRAELQDAASAVNAAYEQIQQSSENLRLTRKSLKLGRISFDEGDIDLITLNIYEAAVADAELQLLDAKYKYFFFRTVFETARTGVAFEQ